MESVVNENGFWNKVFKGELEHDRFAIITMTLLIIGCLGGVAVGLGAVKHTFELILVVLPTMVTLSFLLSVSPMKYILNAAVLTVFIDLILIIFHII